MTRLHQLSWVCLLALVAPGTAAAQAPATPPGWTGSAAAGLALTQGNSDTSTVNAAYELKRDAGGALVFDSSGLFVWGQAEGELTSDRLALGAKLERRLSDRTALFGQTQYLRDSFKSIDYLISPTAGIKRIFLKNDRTELNAAGAIGVVWEQNPDLELQVDGALNAGQQFTHKLTETTDLQQKLTALWKMDDFGDALWALSVGLAAGISERTQLKVEFLDTYKTKPPSDDVRKNDIAVLLSFVYKFE